MNTVHSYVVIQKGHLLTQKRHDFYSFLYQLVMSNNSDSYPDNTKRITFSTKLKGAIFTIR